jgi:hypothetical protein
LARISRTVLLLVVLAAGLSPRLFTGDSLPTLTGTASAATVGDRTLTLVNRTRETIWPAVWPGSVSGTTGWTLPPGKSLSLTVSDTWNARLWGRTGCHFDAAGR